VIAAARVQQEQDDRDDHHRERLDGEVHDAVLEQLAQRFDVARHAGHHSTRLLPGEEVHGQPLQVCEDATRRS
jgi:hypothetical protein